MSMLRDHIKAPHAWVVFSGQTDLFWLKLFKPGFRHCYVLLNDGEHWISLDPLSNYMDVSVHNVLPDFDLPKWLRDRGHTVVSAPVQRLKREAPWMVFTCVEAVKRVIGLHDRRVLTPWQLYRRLKNLESRSFSNVSTQTGDIAWAV